MSYLNKYYLSALVVFALVSPITYAGDTIKAIKKATSFKSEDGDFTIKFKGRVHADAASYDDDITRMDDDTELRRLRAGITGTIMQDWIYSFHYDSESAVGYRIKGAYVGYKGFDNINIKIGNLQQPFSLEELTSSNHILFMERSLANVFAPSYTLGSTVNAWGKRWSFTGGYFTDTLGDRHNDNEGGYSLASRVTFNPIDRRSFKIHLGASAIFRNLDSGQTVSYSTRPESRSTDARLLSTGTLKDVDKIKTYGLEAALIKGAWLLQGEVMQAKLDRKSHSDPVFEGAYVQAGWLITGEKHRYSGKNGTFKRVNPQSPYGALELAVRYSTLDLDDKTVTGGEEDNLSLGVNWYLNRNVRVMANYIQADASPNRNGLNEDANILQFRIQAYL